MTSVLYDNPGPRTRARHRLYSILTVLVLAGIAAYILWLLYDDGQFSYDKWEVFVTPDYVAALFEGLVDTLQMAFLSVIFAVVFGLVFGVAKLSEHAVVRWPAWVIVEFFRAVPVLLLMIFIYLAFGIGDGFGSYWSVVFALMLYNGSVLAEVFRAGINAVPKGQSEAAYAIGMRKYQVMNLILLPQAVKIMLPAIISQMVVAVKDTSLGFAIAAPGLTRIGKAIYQEFNNQVPTVIVLAALYILVNLILTWVATWIQRRFVGEKEMLAVSEAGEDPASAAGPGTASGFGGMSATGEQAGGSAATGEQG